MRLADMLRFSFLVRQPNHRNAITAPRQVRERFLVPVLGDTQQRTQEIGDGAEAGIGHESASDQESTPVADRHVDPRLCLVQGCTQIKAKRWPRRHWAVEEVDWEVGADAAVGEPAALWVDLAERPS